VSQLTNMGESTAVDRSPHPSRVAIVVPCFNEADVLPSTVEQLLAAMDHLVQSGKTTGDSELYFVDDCSKDSTWALIERFASQDSRIRGIKLSRNRGHQNALLAGLLVAEGDAIVSIDADLQDDLDAVEKMVDEYLSGVDIVYGVRAGRHTDSFFKRETAGLFYRLLDFLNIESIHNHADFRLMSRRAVEALREFGEVNLFLRGIVPMVGFPSSTVCYDRRERTAGESKYPLRKMIGLALNGVTSFSVAPLRVISALGFFTFAMSLLVTMWTLWVTFFTDRGIPGWASTVLPMYLLGGIQLLCIGVLGEYLGKIYNEVKGRPRYVIEKRI